MDWLAVEVVIPAKRYRSSLRWGKPITWRKEPANDEISEEVGRSDVVTERTRKQRDLAVKSSIRSLDGIVSLVESRVM